MRMDAMSNGVPFAGGSVCNATVKIMIRIFPVGLEFGLEELRLTISVST